MNRPHRRDHNSIPLGRRVAELRARRGMSQQAFADRLGKSKSWVDKIERGVRKLDRYSVIRDIADVLRLDPDMLLGPRQPPPTAPRLDGVDGVRAALAHYHDRPQRTVTADQARRQVAHAWMTYQHARYPQLLDALPGLLDTTRGTRSLLVATYRITANVLVKLDHPHLAWLAADRAVTVAADIPTLAATASIAVAQALRALGHHQLGLLTAALTATPRLHRHRRSHSGRAGASPRRPRRPRRGPQPPCRPYHAEIIQRGPAAADLARLAAVLGLTQQP